MRWFLNLLVMILFIAPAGFANTCTADYGYDFDLEPAIKKGLRTSLYSYLANPERMENMDKDMLADALDFYFQAAGSVDCDANSGSISGQPMRTVLEHVLVEQLPSDEDKVVLPTCEDGTPYGECSDKRPYFCLGGELVLLCTGPDKQVIMDGDRFKAGEAVNFDNCGCPDRHIEGVIGENTAQFCVDSAGPHFGSCDDGLLSCPPSCPGNIHQTQNYCKEGNVYRDVYNFQCIDGMCREVKNETMYINCVGMSKICRKTDTGAECAQP
jgi:hypothetical protein